MTSPNQYEPQSPPHSHRGAGRSITGMRRMIRVGVLATAALGTVGSIAGMAQAVTVGEGFSADHDGVAAANNTTFALSNAHDQTSFKDSFTIHQYGDVTAAYLRNQATAESVACSPDAPCRAVSLSFQIVTMAGEDIHLSAVNLSDAENVHCAGCQTVAGAYQFVVSTPGAFTLSKTAQTQLEAIHHQLNALSNSTLSADQVQAQADALAAKVAAILKTAAATSPQKPPLQPLSASTAGSPQVTVYKDFQHH
ncbi:MAG TPA: hypothetical protein VL551_29105 [Actinospica sp.]|nr:hypothetical protein [Actinospica sp.]